jgi:hypothetical protein
VNFWSDSPSAFKFPSDSPLLLQLIPLSPSSSFFLPGDLRRRRQLARWWGKYLCVRFK